MREVPPLRMNPVSVSGDGRVLVDTEVVIERQADEQPTYVAAPVIQRR